MEILEFIRETAKGAGAIIRDNYGRIISQYTKDHRGDIVTNVDIESERFILEQIRSTFPDHGIVSEEAGQENQSNSEYVWYVDPLDGTRNYSLGIPFFCVSIALAKNGVSVCGAVYDPLHNELFLAERGRGATLNGNSIEVSNAADLDDAIISISWLRRRTDREEFVGYVDRISRRTSYFRRLGSAALISAYVATGRTDAYLQGAINSWDIAAGTIIIEEAGGKTSDFEGYPIDLRNPYTNIIAANPKLHANLIEEVINSR